MAKVCRLWKEDIGIDTGAIFSEHRFLSLWHSEKSDLQFFCPAVIGNETFYRQLHRKTWYFQPDKWEFREAARHITSPDQVLDLGAGRQPFRRFIDANRYVAVDPFMAQDAAPRPRQKFDVVVAFQVLEHVPDPLGFITMAKSWLKPGGRIFIGIPNRESYLRDLRDFALDMPPHHVSRWSENALASLAQSAQLTIEAITKSSVENWEASLYRMTQLEQVCHVPRPAGVVCRVLSLTAQRAASPPCYHFPEPSLGEHSSCARAAISNCCRVSNPTLCKSD